MPADPDRPLTEVQRDALTVLGLYFRLIGWAGMVLVVAVTVAVLIFGWVPGVWKSCAYC